MRIMNLTQGTELAVKVRMADSFFSRLKGLLGTAFLPDGEALVLKPCSSIHTYGMKYPIDVIFLSSDNRVLMAVAAMAPGRTAMCGGSAGVIELPAGTLEKTRTRVADRIEIN